MDKWKALKKEVTDRRNQFLSKADKGNDLKNRMNTISFPYHWVLEKMSEIEGREKKDVTK